MKKLHKSEIVTIPNLLSAYRLILIPVICWLYRVKQDYSLAVIALGISWLTDIVDGYIARRFHMESDIGKILDPVADKLTQAAVLFCLVFRFPNILSMLLILIIKEVLTGVCGLLVIRNTGEVNSADWHGKIATGAIYITMGVHMLWANIPIAVSNAMVVCCIGMMFVSFVLYGIKNMKILLNREEQNGH